VVGDDALAASALGALVEVGAALALGVVTLGMAVVASGLAPHRAAAVEAGAEQGAGHRLRLRLAALARTWVAHGGQRSPQVMGRLQPRQR
jgi:hypothetical protein